MFEIDHVVQFCSGVHRRSYKHRFLAVEGYGVDLFFVRLNFLQLRSVRGIVQPYRSVVESDQQRLVTIQKHDVGGLHSHLLRKGYLEARLVGIRVRVFVFGDVVDGYPGFVFDEGVGYGGEHGGAVGPGHTADGAAMGKISNYLPGVRFPELDGAGTHKCLRNAGNERRTRRRKIKKETHASALAVMTRVENLFTSRSHTVP
mmetsp:Transcript_6022/g.12933  ORF Transcript_6022/g.12933 Transcript_6022/m.12933 type:complete len:202 (+) Transcript_6022:960-1565(+)